MNNQVKYDFFKFKMNLLILIFQFFSHVEFFFKILKHERNVKNFACVRNKIVYHTGEFSRWLLHGYNFFQRREKKVEKIYMDSEKSKY